MGRRGLVRFVGATLVAVLAMCAVAPAADAPTGKLAFVSTGQHSELRETIPISRHRDDERKSVMSVRLRELPSFRQGDRLELAAEVQVTDTCVLPGQRCVGSRYSFSPRVDGKLVLAGATRAIKGKSLGHEQHFTCSQHRPNRNHHCVMVFSVSKRIANPESLPCGPATCRVNLVLAASHRNAASGDKLVIGADTPGGQIRQDKGRLSAVLRRAPLPAPVNLKSTEARMSRVPVAPGGRKGRVSVASLRLGKLQKGTVIRAKSTHLTSLKSVPYNAFIGSRLVLATRPGAVRAEPFVNKISALDGTLTEQNGFNCTKGPSDFSTPCTTRKAGLIQLVRKPVKGSGREIPLYLNLVVAAYPKLTSANASDSVKIKRVRLSAAIEPPPSP